MSCWFLVWGWECSTAVAGFGVGRPGRGVLAGVTGFTGGCFRGFEVVLSLGGLVWPVFAGFLVGVGVDLCRGWWACNVF